MCIGSVDTSTAEDKLLSLVRIRRRPRATQSWSSAASDEYKRRRIGDELEGDNKYNCIAAGANGKLYAAPYDAGKVLEVDPETSNVKEIGDALEVGEHTNVLLQAPKKNALPHNQAQQKSWRSTPQSFLF